MARLSASKLIPCVVLARIALVLIAPVGAAATLVERAAGAQTYTVLRSFTGNDGHGFTGDPDGANPFAPLVVDSDGMFYGTTVNGSAANTGPTGTVFKMDSSGAILFRRNLTPGITGDGTNPYGGLVKGRDGRFYGTTFQGGALGVGTLFSIDAQGNFTKLYDFGGGNNPRWPVAGLIEASDGNLYGVSDGGQLNRGTVFVRYPSGVVQVLWSFTGLDGSNPQAELIEGRDGLLYGTTRDGGDPNAANVTFGTIFRIPKAQAGAGQHSRLHSFRGSDGARPLGPLIQLADGYLYGTTERGGQYGFGTVFRIGEDGSGFSVLYSFTGGVDGSAPQAGLRRATDGNLYGTTYAGGAHNYGTVFRMSPAGGPPAIVHSFAAVPAFQPTSDGVHPRSELIQAADGTLYGTTSAGGAQNKGVVFRLDLGLPPIGESAAAGKDFDGDERSDVAVFRPGNGAWYVIRSATMAATATFWGVEGDMPVAGDYDGDGRTDHAVYRPSTAAWYVLQSATGSGVGIIWGMAGDKPVPADYDGDGRTDFAVYRPSTAAWYIIPTTTGIAYGLYWGIPGDVPMPADYDGDGKADPTVFRPSTSTWFQLRSMTGTGFAVVWGVDGDVPLAGDYDGDGKADPTVFRSADGTWFQLRSTGGPWFGGYWGAPGDVPIVGDYDGDGKADLTVFRASTSTWYQLRSATGTGFAIVWGLVGDLPM